MASGKWIDGLEATTPVADAARLALTVRLEVVRDNLTLALRDEEQDPAHVHKLRVATRRARAALDIFADCLPKKMSQRVRKSLRELRHSAGEARDWDVFRAGVIARGREQSEARTPATDLLIGYAAARAEAARVPLEQSRIDSPVAFEKLLGKTISAVKKPGKSKPRTLVDLARPTLGNLLTSLNKAAGRNLREEDNLHQVRIRGKRLRYAMEVFAGCFASPFRGKLYPAVAEMQQTLGNVTDSLTAGQRLEAISAHVRTLEPEEWERYRPGVEEFGRYHEEREERERHRFNEWWANWYRAGGEAAFQAMMDNPGEENVALPGSEDAAG